MSDIQIQVLDPENTILNFEDTYTSEDIDTFVLGKFGKNYSWMTVDIIDVEEVEKVQRESITLQKTKTYAASWKQKFEDERAENVVLRRKVRSLEDRTKQALAKQYYLEDVYCGGEINWRHTTPTTENYKRALNEIGWYEFLEHEKDLQKEKEEKILSEEEILSETVK